MAGPLPNILLLLALPNGFAVVVDDCPKPLPPKTFPQVVVAPTFRLPNPNEEPV